MCSLNRIHISKNNSFNNNNNNNNKNKNNHEKNSYLERHFNKKKNSLFCYYIDWQSDKKIENINNNVKSLKETKT